MTLIKVFKDKVHIHPTVLYAGLLCTKKLLMKMEAYSKLKLNLDSKNKKKVLLKSPNAILNIQILNK